MSTVIQALLLAEQLEAQIQSDLHFWEARAIEAREQVAALKMRKENYIQVLIDLRAEVAKEHAAATRGLTGGSNVHTSRPQPSPPGVVRYPVV